MKDLNLFKTHDSFYLRKVQSKEEVLSDLNCDGFFIQSSESETRRIIATLKSRNEKKIIALQGQDDAFNRRAIESLKINYLVSPENNKGKNTLKQRDSGLNHVVAKIAHEKGIGIVINLYELAKLKGKEKAEKIARIMQNVKVCRKAKCKILLASFAEKKSEIIDEVGRKSFGFTLGMSSEEVRDSVKF